MRRSFLFSALALAVILAGCGTTLRPRLGRGPAPADYPQGGPNSPRNLGPATDAKAVVERVCRSQAARNGWIATSYIQGTRDCPNLSDSSNAYNGAIIEFYASKPVGSTMVVCADQAIPRLWVREYKQEAGTACPGARVPDGQPTAIVIRRVSSPGSP